MPRIPDAKEAVESGGVFLRTNGDAKVYCALDPADATAVAACERFATGVAPLG